ncbi:MAG: hypothetical protein ACPLOC_03815 [Candidatus Bathyarchaeales archaeon]
MAKVEKGRVDEMTVQLFENVEFEVVKADIEFYFSKLVNKGKWNEAMDVLKRLRAILDGKIAVLEKAEVARKYESDCPKCGSDEVEWLEKIHDCQDCQVWVISCLECKTEWCDVVWKNS